MWSALMSTGGLTPGIASVDVMTIFSRVALYFTYR